MKHEPWLEKWSYEDDKVILEYEDGATLRVAREDFIRAFGVIIPRPVKARTMYSVRAVTRTRGKSI